MKIESIDIITAATSWRNLIIVKLTTDTGLSGYGEATIEYGDRALLAYLPEIFERGVRGRDPRDIEDIVASMEHADYWRSGFIARTAFSGVELACWDIKGRFENKPVWQLLGEKKSTPLRAYANGWYRGDRDPQHVAKRASRVVAMGYKALKIDPFGAGNKTLTTEEQKHSLAIMREVRQAVGDEIELYIDGHGRFELDTARKLAHMMEPYHPGFFEEPLVPELNHHLPKLIDSTSIPIAVGERLSTLQLFQWVTMDCDRLILQPDICHVGGVLELLKICRYAQDRGWGVAPHNAGGPLATAHAVHVGVVNSGIFVQEIFDEFEDVWVQDAFPGRVRVINGICDELDRPGFGITVDERALASHPFIDQHLDLFAEGWEKRETSVQHV